VICFQRDYDYCQLLSAALPSKLISKFSIVCLIVLILGRLFLCICYKTGILASSDTRVWSFAFAVICPECHRPGLQWLPALKTLQNGEGGWPLYWVICPALMHYDIHPKRTALWFAQRYMVSYMRQNLKYRSSI